jgi:hypothetical protein
MENYNCCRIDTAGNHEWNCPNNPNKIDCPKCKSRTHWVRCNYGIIPVDRCAICGYIWDWIENIKSIKI